MNVRMVLKCGVVISLLVFFLGCSVTLPNIRPFAEQTRRMVSAVDNGYTHAETLLSIMEEPGESSETQLTEEQKKLLEKAEALAESAKNANDRLKELGKNWKLIKKVLNALMAYSDELAALADASTKGEEAANGVTNALGGIITVTNGAFNIPGNLMKAFEKINDTIAKIRGRYALKKAVKEAQPVINEIVKIIAMNFDGLALINKSAGKALGTYYYNANQPMLKYYDVLIKSQDNIFKILTAIFNIKRYEPGTKSYEENLNFLVKEDKVMKGVIIKEKVKVVEEEITVEKTVEKISPKDIEAREKYWLKQLHNIDGEINRLRPQFQAYKTKEEKIKKLTLSGSLIIRRGKIAILAYVKAHNKLKMTLGKKQRMSFVEFASVVQDVVDAYKGGE